MCTNTTAGSLSKRKKNSFPWESYTGIPVEHILIERIKQNKSLVDIKLTARACKEHYQNEVDSFVIVSSDSDYWGLISSMPDAGFLVMIEREKCGPDMKATLADAGVFYCYLDDFYSGNSDAIKKTPFLMKCTAGLTTLSVWMSTICLTRLYETPALKCHRQNADSFLTSTYVVCLCVLTKKETSALNWKENKARVCTVSCEIQHTLFWNHFSFLAYAVFRFQKTLSGTNAIIPYYLQSPDR